MVLVEMMRTLIRKEEQTSALLCCFLTGHRFDALKIETDTREVKQLVVIMNTVIIII